MIGGSLSDIEAGARIGMQAIFIDGDSAMKKADPEKARALAGALCESLLEAAKAICGATQGTR